MDKSFIILLSDFVRHRLDNQNVRLGFTATHDFTPGFKGSNATGCAGVGIWAVVLAEDPDVLSFVPKKVSASPKSYFEIIGNLVPGKTLYGPEAIKAFLELTDTQIDLLRASPTNDPQPNIDHNSRKISVRIRQILHTP